MTSDIVFTPAGKRTEHVTDAPAPSLQRIQMSQQDFDDLEHVQPFVLTTDEVQKYDVKYAGQQQLDEINAYVFDVAPKKMEKNQRYFQGRIWVDQKDFGIVKTDGKAVPDIKKTRPGKRLSAFRDFPRKYRRQLLVSDLHALRGHSAIQHRRSSHSHDRPLRELQAVRVHHQDRPGHRGPEGKTVAVVLKMGSRAACRAASTIQPGEELSA